MERIPASANLEMFQQVWCALPSGIRRYLEFDLCAATDPLWIGLHGFESASYGRSYRDTSHVVSEYNGSDRRCTLVLSLDGIEQRELIVHELGHVLDERLRYDRPDAVALGEYAMTNWFEAFATSFQAYYTPEPVKLFGYHYREELLAADEQMVAFFADLER